MNGLHNIKSLTLNELKTWLKSVGEKPFRAEQIQNWLFRNQVENIEEMVNISPSLQSKMKEAFYIHSLTEELKKESVDGTIKWLFKTHDNHYIETVMIPTNGRFSVCVSTQIGCAMNCSFAEQLKWALLEILRLGKF